MTKVGKNESVDSDFLESLMTFSVFLSSLRTLESWECTLFPPVSPSPYIGAISCTPMINSDAPNSNN